MHLAMLVSEAVGRLLGGMLSPIAAAGSLARGGRALHPEGQVFRGELIPIATASPFFELANRIGGGAVVRFSNAWWKHEREWADILGCAIRLRDGHLLEPHPRSGDQDLLFATLRSAWTLPFAPLTTDTHDFLANDYYALGWFQVPEAGKVKLRLVPSKPKIPAGTRAERLRTATKLGMAVLALEARLAELGSVWTAVADLQLREPVEMDQRWLRFSPFRAGRGIQPKGVLQAMRRGPYRASQVAQRPH